MGNQNISKKVHTRHLNPGRLMTGEVFHSLQESTDHSIHIPTHAMHVGPGKLHPDCREVHRRTRLGLGKPDEDKTTKAQTPLIMADGRQN
jgi:hypothetical protein